nr:magnesium protoporphyrin IX methyltransferase, chloroplastic [Tanacetum cinerariifolium]
MFEILSRMAQRTDKFSEEPDLIRWVHYYYGENEMDKLIDPSIKDQIDGRSLQTFAETAYICLSYNIKERSSLNRIIKKIEEVLYCQAKEELQGKEGLQMPKFEVGDIESLNEKYDTVVCLDVLIHYPRNKADGMIAHLAFLAENRVILSFAPKTFYYDLLKRIGELFPGTFKGNKSISSFRG